MRQLIHDQQGQDLIEYALLAGFVAVAATAVLPAVNENVAQVFQKVNSALRASIRPE